MQNPGRFTLNRDRSSHSYSVRQEPVALALGLLESSTRPGMAQSRL